MDDEEDRRFACRIDKSQYQSPAGFEELGGHAVWSVSSANHGNGVESLRDGNLGGTFWQSDGVAPHHVTVRKTGLLPSRKQHYFTLGTLFFPPLIYILLFWF